MDRIRAATQVVVPRYDYSSSLFQSRGSYIYAVASAPGLKSLVVSSRHRAPAMVEDIMSLCSSPGSEERSLVIHLILITLAGEEIQLTVGLQEFDRLNEFENAVLQQLPYIGERCTFGCELDFIHKDTRKRLVDPIWDTLRDNNCFNLVVRQSFMEAEHKGQLKHKVRALRVPCSATDTVLPHAFSHNMEVRHVQVAAGIRIIGEAAWRSCLQLQVVPLPSTVVILQNGVFRRCHALRTVLAPGCKQFGIKVFEECCSLLQLGTTSDSTNQLAPWAQFRPRAFEKCTALRHLNFEQT